VLEIDFHLTGRTHDFACTCLVTEVSYGDYGDPTLLIRGCRRIFDTGTTSASEHYGLLAELDPGPAA
jgi:hypothetical protein